MKPDNVTMGDPSRLLDLSLAQIYSGPVKLRHSMGTLPYMPPEQCIHGEVTPQSDLFALGVTLYEALSGLRPFSHGDETATNREERYRQLMACLARDPARRPRSAIEAAFALHSVLESLRTDELYAWPPSLRVQRDNQ